MIHVVAKSTHANPKVSNVTHPRTLAWREKHITADTYAFASPPAAATAACTAAMQPSPAISTPTHIALLAAEMIAAFEHFWSKSFAFCAVCWNAAFSRVCTRVRTRPRGVKTYMLSNDMLFRVQWAANGYAPVSFSCLVWMREIPEPSFEKIVCAASSTASGNTSTNTRSAPLNCHART